MKIIGQTGGVREPRGGDDDMEVNDLCICLVEILVWLKYWEIFGGKISMQRVVVERGCHFEIDLNTVLLWLYINILQRWVGK